MTTRWTTILLVAALVALGALGTAAAPAPTVEALLARLLVGKSERDEARAAIVARGRAATPELLLGFSSPEFTIRWEVANILGMTRDPAAVPALVDRVLNDVNPHIRWRSLWALGLIADARTPTLLRDGLASTDPTVHWNAAVGCSMFNVAAGVATLRAGTRSTDEFQAWEAVNALSRLPSAESVAVLGSALDPTRPARVRREATLALGKHIEFDGTRSILEAALRDADPEVRWRAARSLRIELPDTGAAGSADQTVDRMIRARDMARDPKPGDEEHRRGRDKTEVESASGADRGGPPSGADALTTRSNADLDSLLAELRQQGVARARARDALIAAGHGAVPRLLPLLEDADPTVRWEMATILGAIADERAALPLIERVLADADAHVRWRSLFAIAESPGGKAVAVNAFRSELPGKVGSRSWNAAVGLSFFADATALERIYSGLGAADPFMRWEAVNALQRIHDPSAATRLEPIVFGDADARVRREAVLAVGASCAPGAEAVLTRALQEADPEIRWRAAAQLGHCGLEARATLEKRREVELDALVSEQIAEALRARGIPP